MTIGRKGRDDCRAIGGTDPIALDARTVVRAGERDTSVRAGVGVHS